MIKIVGSNKTYKMKQKEFVALKDINLNIESCGLYVLVGESGSGKTTLLNCISGIDSFDNTKESNIIPQGQTAFVFQDYHLIQHLSVDKNAKFIQEINRIKDDEVKDSLFKELNLIQWKDHKPHELSGGQKQRAAIMRALLTDKPIIIADEPTGNLDEENANEIAQILKKISKNKIVIVATHNFLLFQKLADEIFYLKNGFIEKHIILRNDKFNKTPTLSLTKERLKWKHVFMFSLKGYRTQYSKLILMILTSLLSFLFALTAINIKINSVYKIKYNHFVRQDMKFIELVGYKDYYSTKELTSIDDKRLDSLITEYSLNEYMLFVDQIQPRIMINDENTNVIVSRIYITDIVPFNNVKESKKLGDNECTISEVLAKQIIDVTGHNKIEDLLDQTISINNTSLMISNIALNNPKGYNENLSTNQEKQRLEDSLQSIFVNDYTYRKVSNATKRNVISIKLNESDLAIRITNYEDAFHRNLAYGDFELSDNEVIISTETAESIAEGNISTLIGKPISFEIFRYLYGIYEPVSSVIKTFYIKGIFTSSSEQIPWMFNDNTYEEISYMYGKNNYHSLALNGIAISSYSPSKLKSLDKNNITDYTYSSDSINDTDGYIKSVATILLVFGLVLLVLSILIIISYMNNSIINRKSEIGLLSSLNIGMKDISKIFLFEITNILLIIVFITGIFEFSMINIFNSMLISQALTSFNYIYYNPLALAVIVFIPFVFILMYSSIVTKKLKKYTAIELIKFV